MADLSKYDQFFNQFGNIMSTKLEESMALFKIILKWFCNASIILMLNKIDIFKKKIKLHSNTYEYFPRFKGQNNDLNALETFILSMVRFMCLSC